MKPFQIKKEDLPGDVPQWFEVFLEQLNPWAAGISKSAPAANTEAVKEISFTTAVSVEDTWPLEVENPLSTPPQEVRIARLMPESKTVFDGLWTAPVSVLWRMSGNIIQVTICGLQDFNSERFSVRLVVK
jgi:hypothetical protein